MNICRYSKEHAVQWNDFNKHSKNGLFQFDRGFMDYHSDRFTDHSLMFFDEEGKLLALFPANEKEQTIFSHQGLTFGGVIISSSMRAAQMLHLFEALVVYLKSVGVRRMVYKPVPYIYHKSPAGEDLYALFRVGATPFRIDVSTTVQLDAQIGFSELRKRGVKKASKAGIVVGRTYNYNEFMLVLSEVLSAKHGVKPVHTIAEIELLAGRFPDHIHLYTAMRNEVVLAGVLVFEYDTVAHAQYIAATTEGRDAGALDAIFSYLINDRYSGKKFFDFGISTEQNGTLLNEGLITQKEGFGGRAIVHQFFELALGN